MYCTSLGECGIRVIHLRVDDYIANLTSPGFPLPYRNDLICLWTIRARDDRLTRLTFLTFQLEHDYDFLTVGTGVGQTSRDSIVARLTGVIKLRSMTLEEEKMWVQISTDRTGTDVGFHLEIYLVAEIGKSLSN